MIAKDICIILPDERPAARSAHELEANWCSNRADVLLDIKNALPRGFGWGPVRYELKRKIEQANK